MTFCDTDTAREQVPLPLLAQAVLKLFGTRQVEARHRFCDLLSIKVCESTFGPPKMLPEASCAT